MTNVDELLEKLLAEPAFSELLDIWRQRHKKTWSVQPEIYLRLGRAFIKEAEYLLGLDVLAAGASQDPAVDRQRALAFAGMGATDRAREILEALKSRGHEDSETLGILARTYKDTWRQDRDRNSLISARDLYRTTYDSSRSAGEIDLGGACYNGINAATTSFLLGDVGEAQRIAREVEDYCNARIRKQRPAQDYWALATLGEAALLLGNHSAARKHYQRAVRLGGARLRDIAATRRQAREILRKLGRNPAELDLCFGIGPVVVFAGHMVDTPARLGKPPRFPAKNVKAVSAAIKKAVSAKGPMHGCSSAACGSDILFLEALRNAKIPASIVLPFARREFEETSVAIAGPEWVRRYRHVLATAGKDAISEISRTPLVLAYASYDYANEVLLGMARIRADELGTALEGLAVWDGLPGDGPGGTASIIARWGEAELKFEVIPPNGTSMKRFPRPEVVKPKGDTQIVAVLFADVVKFSKMTEQQTPLFAKRFLPVIAKVIRRRGKPLFRNTWGDGLFFAFHDVAEAGHFALDLQQAVSGKDWEACGLPKNLNLRMGLHAGPAYRCRNPVTGRPDLLGFHVSRAARIEPKTETGQIFCSREYAALVRAQDNRDFAFEYAGRIVLPKRSGVVPLYRLRRRVSQ